LKLGIVSLMLALLATGALSFAAQPNWDLKNTRLAEVEVQSNSILKRLKMRAASSTWFMARPCGYTCARNPPPNSALAASP